MNCVGRGGQDAGRGEVQKAESADKSRLLKKEAELLVHSWPDEWFRKSKKVPLERLEPETEEVPHMCLLSIHVVF